MLRMCKYKTFRSKNGIKQSFCRLTKTWCPMCHDCGSRVYKQYKTIKNGSNPLKKQSPKQRKMESKRFSLFTDDMDHCIECGLPRMDKHEIFRGANRHNSMKYGFVIPLCRCHHDDPKILRKWEKLGQKKFVESYGYEKFIKVFKINFIRRRAKNEKNVSEKLGSSNVAIN